MMKKLLTTVLLAAGVIASFAGIDPKFRERYEMQSLELNTIKAENSLSLYEDGSLIFLRDGKVMTVVIDTASTNLLEEVELDELSAMNIHGTVGHNGKTHTIYFTVKEDKETEWIYESTYKDGKWSNPKRIVIENMEKLRGETTFFSNAGWSYAYKPVLKMLNPFLTADGNRLYFSSDDIAGGRGGLDVWYLEKKDDKMWKYPVNAGDTINTDKDDEYLFIDADGDVYFTSNRSGNTQIYTLRDDSINGYGAYVMDTTYNSLLVDENIVVYNKTPFLISNRGVVKGRDIYAFVKLPDPEPEPEPEPEPVVEEEPIIITFPWTFFLFEFDKYVLTDRFLREIDAMAEAMKLMPEGTRYEIQGHTDQRGSDAYNDKLSQRRADMVRDKLIEKGIDPNILVAKGYGKRKPIFANPANEDEFYQNRRVVVDILDESGNVIDVNTIEIIEK